MGQKQRISRIMIAVIAGILVLYAFMQVPLHPVKKVQDGINRFLMEKSEETYLTGFAYLEGGKEASFSDWVTESAMKLVPLGTYVEGKASVHTDVEDEETYAMILAQQANDENAVDENGQLLGGDDKEEEVAQTSGTPIDTSMENLKNFEYLVGNFYTIDGNTMADGDLLNAEKLMGKDLKIDQSKGGPKVLIYHTHSQEAFADSTEGDTSTTIMGMGAISTDLLTIHTGSRLCTTKECMTWWTENWTEAWHTSWRSRRSRIFLPRIPASKWSLTFTGTAWQKGLIW